jgi:hypothetical protein
MTTGKRHGVPRYLRRIVVGQPKGKPVGAPVLVRTIAFVPAYQRKRLH